jgi:hypothetical protein
MQQEQVFFGKINLSFEDHLLHIIHTTISRAHRFAKHMWHYWWYSHLISWNAKYKVHSCHVKVLHLKKNSIALSSKLYVMHYRCSRMFVLGNLEECKMGIKFKTSNCIRNWGFNKFCKNKKLLFKVQRWHLIWWMILYTPCVFTYQKIESPII